MTIDNDAPEIGPAQERETTEGTIYTVTGGAYGEFDVPGVRPFVRVFAPRRGEIVIDAEALDLVPPKRRGDESRPKAPRRRARSRSPKPVAADSDAPTSADATEA